MATLISARSVLQGAPMSWTLLTESESSLTVSVTTRHLRDNSVIAGSTYLETSEVEIVRDTWELWHVDGPLSGDDADELCADVQRWAESGCGVRYHDVFACAGVL